MEAVRTGTSSMSVTAAMAWPLSSRNVEASRLPSGTEVYARLMSASDTRSNFSMRRLKEELMSYDVEQGPVLHGYEQARSIA